MKDKHVHKYIRTKLGSNGYIVYKCAIPGCPHFINETLVVGRRTICWRCGNETTVQILPGAKGLLKKPHCPQCTKGRKVTDEQSGLLEHFKSLLEV